MDYNQEKLQNHPRLSRLAWLPVLLLLAAMAAFWVADLRTAHESPFLLLVLNFVFSLLASFLIAFLIARSFLVRRTPELLLVGCGVIAWGAAGLAGVTFGILGAAGAPLDTNLFIAIHNLCVWLSALCHLAGAAFSLRPKREIPAAGRWLAPEWTRAGVAGTDWIDWPRHTGRSARRSSRARGPGCSPTPWSSGLAIGRPSRRPGRRVGGHPGAGYTPVA